MERFEPAWLDVHSATWDRGCTTGAGPESGGLEGSYVPQQGARRYESYEMSFAAKVCCRGRCTSLHRFASATCVLTHTHTCAHTRTSAHWQVGLGIAAEYALAAGPERSWRRVQRLAASLRAGLALLDGVHVHDHGALLCGIVTFSKDGQAAEQLRAALAAAGINVSVSRVPSTRLLFQDQGVDEVVRASAHYYNDELEVRSLLVAVEAA